jgi:hypothetical protein
MTEKQAIIALGLSTDGNPAELSDAALWQKAVGVFKGNVRVEQVVLDGDAPKPKKKSGLKKRAATTKKKAKKKTTRHARD